MRGHPNAPQPQQNAPPNGIGANGYATTPNGGAGPNAGPGSGPGNMSNANGPMMSNGVGPHGTPQMQTPLQNMPSRPSLPSQGGAPATGSSSASASQQRNMNTPKTPKQPRQSTSSLPAPPLDDVHAAFVEFRAKEEDKV